jgi:hypothetical protein
MKNRALFWIGLVIYLTSFFLVGATGPGREANANLRGYAWAWWALVIPWEQIGLWTRAPEILPATAIAGIINPLFFAATFALVSGCRRSFTILRIVILLIIPFCWVPFLMGFHPREGYALWIVGMITVLFSNRRESTPVGPVFQSTLKS